MARSSITGPPRSGRHDVRPDNSRRVRGPLHPPRGGRDPAGARHRVSCPRPSLGGQLLSVVEMSQHDCVHRAGRRTERTARSYHPRREPWARSRPVATNVIRGYLIEPRPPVPPPGTVGSAPVTCASGGPGGVHRTPHSQEGRQRLRRGDQRLRGSGARPRAPRRHEASPWSRCPREVGRRARRLRHRARGRHTMAEEISFLRASGPSGSSPPPGHLRRTG